MSEEITVDEIALSISICNHLFAILQGEYAKLKSAETLELESLESLPTQFAIEDLEIHLTEISAWAKFANQGQPLFRIAWDNQPKTLAAKKTLSLLDKSVVVNLQDANFTKDLAARFEEVKSDKETLKIILCLVAKKLYIRDNYIKFEKIVKDEPQSDEPYEKTLPLLNDLIIRFKSLYPFPDLIINALKEELEWSYRLFRVYANDAKIKRCLFKPCKFEDTIIPKSVLSDWISTGLAALVAANWYCYDFSPNEALEWISFGLEDPSIFWIWKFYNFDPASARDWIAAGCTVKEALEYTKKGKLPNEIKQGS